MASPSWRYQDGTASSPARRWWKLSQSEMPGSISAILQSLAQAQHRRFAQHTISARLYGNLPPTGIFGPLVRPNAVGQQAVLRDRITYNVVQSVIDTITSKIAKNKPRPLFLTSGGDYKQQRKAKKLTQFTDGVFYENDAYRLGTEVFRDACVFGTGALKVFDSAGRVKLERVLTGELFVDEVEGFYGEPRQLHHVKNVDREVLFEMFGDVQGVRDAAPARIYETETVPAVSDQVTVRESWHLPSGPEANDGKHVITVGNSTLLSESYDKPFFPFAFFHWTKRLYGFWGQGLAEQVQNIQVEINKLLYTIQRSMHLAGSFKIFLENGSKVVKEHLNNEIGTILTYTGTKPDYVVPPIIPPEIYQHLLTLKQAAFEQAGVSQLSAAAKKPDGLNSGKALREFNDIESDRFMTVGQSYERFFIDLARLCISTAKDIVEEKKHLEVKIPGKRFIDSIDFKNVSMEEDEYVLKVYPVSSLPNDPAGRLQTVTEYIQGGFISPVQGRRLLDFPDLDHIEDLANAEEEYLTKILDKMIEDGEYVPPESYDDLNMANRMAMEQYARGKSEGLEEPKLELLRRFMGQIHALLNPAPPPMPPGADGQLSPQALPEPLPTSPLVPNVPAPAPAMA